MAVVRYYRPGVNWVGRVLFLVPVLGVALIAMSGGQWGYADGWVSTGLAVWVVVAMVAEGVLWPAERRLQQVVAAPGGRRPRRRAAPARVDDEPGDPRRAVPAVGAGSASAWAWRWWPWRC